MTPWEEARNRAERALSQAERADSRPEFWGPFHRHFCSDAIHRDGRSECDQPGAPRRVYVFDPEDLSEHEKQVARYAIAHPEQFSDEASPD